MKNRKFIYLKQLHFRLLLSLASVVKEKFRMKLSSQLFKTLGSFIDGFTGGLNYPFEGSYFQAFTVDQETKYKGLQLCDLTYLTLETH
jgi:hypothetical protein